MNLTKSMSAEVEQNPHSLILLPVGSLEQHGTEAPLGCDALIAEALCKEAGNRTGVPVLPALYYGNSECHKAFPGTFSLSVETYSKLLEEIINEAARNGFQHILIISGHGGNRIAAEKAILSCKKNIACEYLGYWQLPGVGIEENKLFNRSGYHITSTEVSMIWFLEGKKIPGKFIGAYPSSFSLDKMKKLTADEWKLLFPDGGAGSDLSDASLEKGESFFNFVLASLVNKIQELV